ncbi:MAG: ATP-binding cassette domain-containing protein [Betaproteobacteria bacterium]|nr:ATP-binding cassette domain-containing protein [Betaproteobacteria bacterium]
MRSLPLDRRIRGGQCSLAATILAHDRTGRRTVHAPPPVRIRAVNASAPSGPDDELAIALRDVEHTYASGTRALQPTTVDVRSGEFVSIIGPSGCGKSTLMRLVAGLEQPARGRVSRHAGLRIAYVFQHPTLMPWARVRDNVRLPLELAGRRRQDIDRVVDDALVQVGLTEFSDAFPRELSGGMQMRVSIARALATEPGLLLMDEPFGALDEITRERLDRELLELASRRNLTVLFVTHSLHEAVYLSTRILVMSPRPGRVTGELAVPDALPRPDDFRVSERYARLCGRLGAMLKAAAGT